MVPSIGRLQHEGPCEYCEKCACHYKVAKMLAEAWRTMNDRYDEFGPEGCDKDYPEGPIGDVESIVNEDRITTLQKVIAAFEEG